MDLMLNLISLTPKISAFSIKISLGRPYAEGAVTYIKMEYVIIELDCNLLRFCIFRKFR